jgi:signal transduction histidine kinase
VETPQESLARLRLEVAELRASRERLVLAADADRRSLERDLHEGVQQHLIALAVNLQLAGPLLDSDPEAAKALLDEIGRDVQQALDESAKLAQRIYTPLLEPGGLAAALRSAAVSPRTRVSVELRSAAKYPPEVARTVYLCCIEALERAGAQAPVRVSVRDEEGAIAFDVVEDGARSATARTLSDDGLDRLRDRVEALGGQLTVLSEPGRGLRVSGSLPLGR